MLSAVLMSFAVELIWPWAGRRAEPPLERLTPFQRQRLEGAHAPQPAQKPGAVSQHPAAASAAAAAAARKTAITLPSFYGSALPRIRDSLPKP